MQKPLQEEKIMVSFIFGTFTIRGIPLSLEGVGIEEPTLATPEAPHLCGFPLENLGSQGIPSTMKMHLSFAFVFTSKMGGCWQQAVLGLLTVSALVFNCGLFMPLTGSCPARSPDFPRSRIEE